MEKRTEKLSRILNELNIDGLFITDLYNLRYFTGFTGTTGVALATKYGNFFFSDFRYKTQATREVSEMGFEFVEVSRGSLQTVGEYIKKFGLKNVGFEDINVSFSLYQTIKEIFKVELAPVGNKLVMERMVKSNEETFTTIFASGYRSAMPHGVASDKKIQKEEFITMDFGAYYEGYVSDITRTVYYGNNITEKHKEIYNMVLEAQLLGINTIKEGIMSDEVDKTVRNFFNEKGYGEYFGHGLGHGIGAEIHELPYLSSASQIELKENMVVTSEPGLYFDGWGGVRIEDDVVVKKDGREVLNKSNKELIILS